MTDLDEHNKRMAERRKHRKEYTSKANVECPECGTEMHYPNPNTVLLSSPPKKHVKCPNCEYTGYKVVG